MGLVPVGMGPGAGLGALAGLPPAAAAAGFFLMGLCVGGLVGGLSGLVGGWVER